MCVVHYSLIFQAFSHVIIMWTSYLWFTVWLHLTYISYCFTLLHCNVALSSFTFDTFFLDEVGHENFVSLVIAIHHNDFGITFIHTLNRPIISSKQFVYFQLSSKSSFMLHIHPNISCFFVIIIHVRVVFIRHNYFGISFIHTFQLDKSFIPIVHLCVIIIQKVHWCSIFIQTFHPFSNFHPCTCGRIFSMSFLCGIGIF
jgi:hypothetical protein